MNPSDTHIERMASLFAERFAAADAERPEAKEAWKNALDYARNAGALQKIHDTMADEGQDTQVTAAWDQARKY